MAFLFLPIPPVDPISGIVFVIGNIFAALFGGIFGGGADPNIAKAFNGLRDQMVSMGNAIMRFGWKIAQGVAAVFELVKLLWQNILKPLVQALNGLIQKIKRLMDKILKPLMDAVRRQRQAILDIYNRFVRPFIIFIEKLRRIIHLLQLFHIHIFDALDRKLARLEIAVMTPILDALRRVNTIGNWVSFILNGRLLIFRGLFLPSLAANQGGAFSILASAPAYGFAELPHVDVSTPAPPAPPSFANASLMLVAANPDIQARFANTPADQLVACWNQPIGNIDVTKAIDDMIHCLTS